MNTREYIPFNGNDVHRNWFRDLNADKWAKNDRLTRAAIEQARVDTQKRRAAAALKRSEIEAAAKAARHATVRLMGVRSAKAVAA